MTTREDLTKEAAAFKRCFGGEDGKRVLEILAAEYPSDPDHVHRGGDTHATSFKLGGLSVLHFINLMVNYEEKP